MSRPNLVTRPSSRLTESKTIVLVTGSNQGIGYEIVKALATTKPNFQVLLGCRDPSKGEAAVASMGAPQNVNPIQLDLSDDDSVEHCRKTVEQLFGRLDILINNAGTGGLDATNQGVADGSREMWQHVLNVNVISTGYFTGQMIPLLERSKLPKIIFLSSSLGSMKFTQDDRMFLPIPWYNCSKAAVNMLTVYYSKQYPNFKVNASCPGYRATAANGGELNEDTDPALGAVNVIRLVDEGVEGATGTFTNTDGTIPW